jgi:hypothetical protein
MSDIPIHKLRPGRKTHRTRIEEPGLALSPSSTMVSSGARQKNRNYDRYADEVEQEEEQGLLDNGEYDNPITVVFKSLPSYSL